MVAGLIMQHRVKDDPERMLEAIEKNQSFLLSGGAGSGKTYVLVEIISKLFEKRPLTRVACITYTNAAVREIEERVQHNNLRVSTIHEFLWDAIKHFQNELSAVLVDLINDESVTGFDILDENGEPKKIKKLDAEIQYKDYVKLSNGVISHDELLVIAGEMFARYEKLCRITRDCFPCIFVDEYQDTSKIVVQILLEYLSKPKLPYVVGFFGDAMQSIYDDGIGDLDSYKGEGYGKTLEIKREQNRRNPKLVIDLANTLRNDGLVQRPSDDMSAPNMLPTGEIKSGSVKFLYSTQNDVNKAKSYLGWDFSNNGLTKELNLTHNLIAAKGGFSELMRIYDADKILEFVRRIKKYIFENALKIQLEGRSFKDILDELQSGKMGKSLAAVSPTLGMQTYIDEHIVEYRNALDSPFLEISSLYVDKDQLIDDKKNSVEEASKSTSTRDDLIKHLFKIEKIIQFYVCGNFNEFTRATDYNIFTHKDKLRLRTNIDELIQVDGLTIAQVIEKADSHGIVKIDDKLVSFQNKKKYLYNQVGRLAYSDFRKLFEYLEGFTPFSTQHKTKGREFSNVLVVLDNGKWNNYNFDYLLTNRQDKESVVNRTRKIFYVCCTRAKDNLAVFYPQPSDEVLSSAKVLFGSDNVVSID